MFILKFVKKTIFVILFLLIILPGVSSQAEEKDEKSEGLGLREKI